jgi:hypothetical protein
MSNLSTTRTGGKHPVNILHLVMGVVFLGVVSIWALLEGEVATTEDLRWLIPLPWVVAGGAGLVVIMMSGRRDAEAATPAHYTQSEADVLLGYHDTSTDLDPPRTP